MVGTLRFAHPTNRKPLHSNPGRGTKFISMLA